MSPSEFSERLKEARALHAEAAGKCKEAPHSTHDKGLSGFFWSATDEPHKTRRAQIVAKYPHVKKLFGPCPWLKYKVLAMVAIQLMGAYTIRQASIPVFLFFAYTLSGTCNNFLTLAMHELAHNLAFKNPFLNRVFSLFANFPLGIPAAISFKRYHMEHHKYQGEAVVDVDVPTDWEGRTFRGRLMKTCFLLIQAGFYSLRPLFTNPKKPSQWEVINILAQVLFDGALYHLLGLQSLLYLILGTILGMGIHPIAGHFVAEHFVYQRGQETYSYYGPLNWLGLNVGYHNEHHDFPYVPGSRLHQIRQLAPEFYMDMPHYYSWVKVLCDFVRDDEITPYNRVKRVTLTEEQKAALASQGPV